MASNGSRMALPKYVQETDQGVILAIRVQPRASRNEIIADLGDEQLKVRIAVPPVDSAANKASPSSSRSPSMSRRALCPSFAAIKTAVKYCSSPTQMPHQYLPRSTNNLRHTHSPNSFSP